MSEFKLSDDELTRDPLTIFELTELLGEGSYGKVHKGIHKRTNSVVAVKIVPIENDLESTVKEISVMSEIQSPQIVQFHGSFLKDQDLWIVMEYCAVGSMSEIMRMCKKVFTEEQIAYVMKDTLKGLSYLHSKKKIHRDIKAGNILLTSKGEAKLADFGVSGQLGSTIDKKKTVIGSPFWMAPEVVQETGHGVKADIWSLGITCIELAEGRPPYHNIHPMRVVFLIPTKPAPTLQESGKFSADFIDFIEKCLQKNPEQRATAADLLEHPFIKKSKGPETLNDTVKDALQKIAAGGLKDDEDDGSETVKPKAQKHVSEESGDIGDYESSTMITNPEDSEDPEDPIFMQMIKMGNRQKLTDLDDLVKGGNVAAIEEMLKDLQLNKDKELTQTKEKFEKKKKPILEALASK